MIKFVSAVLLALAVGAQSSHANAQAPIDFGFGNLKIGMDYNDALSLAERHCRGLRQIMGSGIAGVNCDDIIEIQVGTDLDVSRPPLGGLGTIIVWLGEISKDKFAQIDSGLASKYGRLAICLLYTSPSPRDS